MNKKLKLGTLLCATVLIMLAAAQIILAEAKIKGDYCCANGGLTYKYTWYQDEKGNKWTVWTVNGQSQVDYNDHVHPGPCYVIDNNNSLSTPLQNPTTPMGVIIMSGFGEILLQSNQPVNSQIIDHSTGGVVGTATINGNGSISTGTLEAGKTYFILSTNNAGATDNKMFMLNNDKQIWIGK